ncbi:MAG: PAS domain S-box protein [Firmicutes bacterium]|jgi:PAS domain S-box-containing protein|nr:PAS domain S-box protein [Bacillota bacterium]
MSHDSDKTRRLFENLPDAFAYHHLIFNGAGEPVDFIILDVNRAFENLAGMKRTEMIGREASSLPSDFIQDAAACLKVFGEVALTGRHSSIDQYFAATKRWYNILASSDEAGFFAASYRDITERKDAVERLIEKEARLRTLVNLSRDGIVIINQEHQVIDANRRFCEMLGYSPAEILKLHTWDWEVIMPEHEIRRVFQDLTKINENFETLHRRKDGSTFAVEVSATGARVGGENAVICVCRDISARKRAEEALKQSEAKFRTFVENASDIIFTIDRQGNITYISPNIEKISGFPASEYEGKNYTAFIHPDDVSSFLEYVRQCFETKREQQPLEYRVRHQDGVWRWHSLNASITDAINDEEMLIGISRNITEHKKYEEQLEYLSFYDQLTGLYNRALYEKEIERLQNSDQYPISLMLCDLDDLKIVNDTQGHQNGDRLLKACADLIKASIRRERDIVARFGGDEFVAILPETDEGTCKKNSKADPEQPRALQ